jgi:hypothetical protein
VGLFVTNAQEETEITGILQAVDIQEEATEENLASSDYEPEPTV